MGSKRTQVIAASIALLVCLGLMARLSGCKLPSIVPPPDAVLPDGQDEKNPEGTVASEWAELLSSYASIIEHVDAKRPYAIRKVRYGYEMAKYLDESITNYDACEGEPLGTEPQAVADLFGHLKQMVDPDADVTDELRAQYVAALRDGAQQLRGK